MIAVRRVRRGRPRLGTRGGKHISPSVHRNSPSRSDWLPLDMRTTPPATMPAFRGFEESSSDGVVSIIKYLYVICIVLSIILYSLEYK